MKKKQKQSGRTLAVVVTTEHRGIFFGYAEDPGDGSALDRAIEKKWIALTEARNCLYWPTETKGFMGLASGGPPSGARVGPAVAGPFRVNALTSIMECEPAAIEAWEKSPWSR